MTVCEPKPLTLTISLWEDRRAKWLQTPSFWGASDSHILRTQYVWPHPEKVGV
jgi:hypothetical protein